MKKRTIKHRPFNVAVVEHFKKNAAAIDDYLTLAFAEYEQDGNIRLLLESLSIVAEAKGGVAHVARETKLSRQSIYNVLSGKTNPTLDTLEKILKALGYTLAIAPIAKAA